MGGFVFLVCVVLMPVICSYLVAGKRDGPRLAGLICFAGITFLLLLGFFNDAFPFAGGGDDEEYFKASKRSFESLGDWFDTGKYEQHEQKGYPLLLSWVHQFAGDSLFHLKALNVFFLLQIAVVWFVIGKVMGGRRLAFIYASGVLLATPLWSYWVFLLKDMTIAFLQSIFILGLVLFISRKYRFRGYVVIAVSTLAIIPFRSMMALFNVALLVVCMFLPRGSGTSRGSWALWLTLVASLVLGLWLLLSQPGMMEALGAKGETRSLTAEAVQAQAESAETQRRFYHKNPLTFPLLFLVGEADALNPAAWGRFDRTLLRPLSMVPWIYFGLPFVLAGIAMMFRRRPPQKVFALEVGQSGDSRAGEDWRRRQSSSLLVLLAFIVAYGGLAWFSADTTRMTLSAIPPMVGIAGFGWANMSGNARITLLTAWIFSFSVLIFMYYLVLR
jgi:hypothetical protein